MGNIAADTLNAINYEIKCRINPEEMSDSFN